MDNKRFSPDATSALARDAKLGVLATASPEGQPHISLITSMQAKDETTLMWGQFCQGKSKQHVLENPRVGFCVLTPERWWWRGQATWTGRVTEGEDYVMYNNKPLFRYNTYFGINTVHYATLACLSHRQCLSYGAMLPGLAALGLARGAMTTGLDAPILTPYGQTILDAPTTVKFLSFLDPQGHPAVLPLAAAGTADTRRLVWPLLGQPEALQALQGGQSVAVLGVNMQMESVLVRGVYLGSGRRRGVTMAGLDIGWVYNSMPPNHGQIYPPVPLEPVTRF